jgi:hypothetical protein
MDEIFTSTLSSGLKEPLVREHTTADENFLAGRRVDDEKRPNLLQPPTTLTTLEPNLFGCCPGQRQLAS